MGGVGSGIKGHRTLRRTTAKKLLARKTYTAARRQGHSKDISRNLMHTAIVNTKGGRQVVSSFKSGKLRRAGKGIKDILTGANLYVRNAKAQNWANRATARRRRAAKKGR